MAKPRKRDPIPFSADPTMDTLAKLRDKSAWKIVENVPIFPCFSQPVKVGDKTEQMEVTLADLEEICRNYQRRMETSGTVGRITPGHIKPLAPETEQPTIYGHPMNLRIGHFGPKQEVCILCDCYVRPECWEDFKRYPYRSPEYYHDRKEITGVALLIRDPKLDLGMLTFSGRPGCFYFAMDYEADSPRTGQAASVGDNTGPIDPTQPPVAEEPQNPNQAAAAAPEGVPEEFYGHWMACMRHHFPDQCAAMAFPSGTNGALPERAESQHMSQPTAPTTPAAPTTISAAASVSPVTTPPAETEPQRMAREQQAAQFARQEERLRILETQLVEERRARERAEVERQLIQFESECIGVKFERSVELERMIAMTGEQRGKHFQYMRDYYGRDTGVALTHPAHQGFIDQADSPTMFERNGEEVEEFQTEELAYQLQLKAPSTPWEKCMEQAREKRKKKTA